MTSSIPTSLSVVLEVIEILEDLGVLMAVGDCLDEEHLDAWAKTLGLSDLLERARKKIFQG